MPSPVAFSQASLRVQRLKEAGGLVRGWQVLEGGDFAGGEESLGDSVKVADGADFLDVHSHGADVGDGQQSDFVGMRQVEMQGALTVGAARVGLPCSL